MQPTHWIPVDGAELAVEYRAHAGDRLPLVMLHAGVTDSRLWQAAFEAAAAERPVLRMDRRGFGQTRVTSPRPHAWVADLLAVLDALGLDRVEVLGCSLGGRIALDLALAHPQRVAGLMLVAPAVSGVPAPELDPASQALAQATEAARARGDLAEVNRLQAHLWLDGPGQAEGRVTGAARELFLDMNRIALASPSAGPLQDAPSAWARLEALACPVHLVWGDLDLPYLVERCQTLQARIPGAKGWPMTGVAHLPSLEAPERFNAQLRAAGWLR